MANTRSPSLDNILENAIKILEKEGYKDVAENAREFLKKSERENLDNIEKCYGIWVGEGAIDEKKGLKYSTKLYVDKVRGNKIILDYLENSEANKDDYMLNKDKRIVENLKEGYVVFVGDKGLIITDTNKEMEKIVKIIPYGKPYGKEEKEIGEIKAIIAVYKNKKGETSIDVYKTIYESMLLEELEESYESGLSEKLKKD